MSSDFSAQLKPQHIFPSGALLTVWTNHSKVRCISAMSSQGKSKAYASQTEAPTRRRGRRRRLRRVVPLPAAAARQSEWLKHSLGRAVCCFAARPG
jgi:hypothetical protein